MGTFVFGLVAGLAFSFFVNAGYFSSATQVSTVAVEEDCLVEGVFADIPSYEESMEFGDGAHKGFKYAEEGLIEDCESQTPEVQTI